MKRSHQSRRTAAQMRALAAVRKEVHSQDSTARSKYLREFSESFANYDSVLSEEQVLQEVSSAGIVLIGDYHALPASQRFASELIEKVAREHKVVLALEAILARDQQILNSWWRREIGPDELRHRLRFDREWGYPWEPVHDLLNSARDHAEGVYALDCMPREDLRRIRTRDRHAALKIREIYQRHPGAIIIVLFGESHLAPQHLPAELSKALPTEKFVTVLQNLDHIYWNAVGENAAAVSLAEDAICVFNSSPLEKYESYRLCLERWKTTKDEQQDFTPAIYNLIFSLARSLGFRLDSPQNGTQPKFLADSLPEVIAVDEVESADFGLEEKTCRYIPGSNSFAIREFHIADAAGECARFVHSACRGMSVACAQAAEIEQGLARFGARLLCPEITADPAASPLGDALYDRYLANKISKPEMRKLFLSHLETSDQANRTLENITRLVQWQHSPA
ncbi:MAG TPA: ChaN family lipoprotein [Terriglobales bacterium]|nr:ChaN family lipoprotein [Terriglobales bacterium]